LVINLQNRFSLNNQPAQNERREEQPPVPELNQEVLDEMITYGFTEEKTRLIFRNLKQNNVLKLLEFVENNDVDQIMLEECY